MPNERRMTPRCAETGPSLRAAPENAAARVARFALGATKGCTTRLVCHVFGQQRKDELMPIRL
jgi:hypothetical protein